MAPPPVGPPQEPLGSTTEEIIAYLLANGDLDGTVKACEKVAQEQSVSTLKRQGTRNGVGGLLWQAEDGGNKRADDHPRTFIELTPRRRRVGRVLVLRFIGYCACSEGEIFSPSPPSRRGPSSLIALPPLPRAQATRKARCSS